MHSFIFSFILSFIHPFILFFIHSFILSLIHSFIDAFLLSFNHSFIFFIRAFIHFFIHPFIDPLIRYRDVLPNSIREEVLEDSEHVVMKEYNSIKNKLSLNVHFNENRNLYFVKES